MRKFRKTKSNLGRHPRPAAVAVRHDVVHRPSRSEVADLQREVAVVQEHAGKSLVFSSVISAVPTIASNKVSKLAVR